MTATAAARPATPGQVAFIVSLAAERQYPVAGADVAEATVLERIMDAQGGKDLSFAEARDAITYLKPRPRVTGATRTGPLYELPLAKFCLERKADASLHFFEVVERKGGSRFVNRLVGAPGDWRRYPVSYSDLVHVVAAISKDSKGALLSFMSNAQVCARCLSPLSAATSLEVGVGPVCRKALGL